MNAMLDARIVAARIHGSVAFAQAALSGAAATIPLSHGNEVMEAMISAAAGDRRDLRASMHVDYGKPFGQCRVDLKPCPIEVGQVAMMTGFRVCPSDCCR